MDKQDEKRVREIVGEELAKHDEIKRTQLIKFNNDIAAATRAYLANKDKQS